MKRKSALLGALAVVTTALIFYACQKNLSNNQKSISQSSSNNIEIPQQCGFPQVSTLYGGQTIEVGTVTVGNDADGNLYVTYTTTGGWHLSEVHVKAVCNTDTDPETMCRVGDPNDLAPGQFPYSQTFDATGGCSNLPTTYTVVIPKADVPCADPACYCIYAHAVVVNCDNDQTETAWSGETLIKDVNRWYYFINYCTQKCVTPPYECPCQFKTYTQGGYGAPPHKGNPAAFLKNNFATCFPDGVTIGCSNGYTLKLTTAQAVMDFLPQGKMPFWLQQNYENPGSGNITVLAGQLVTAKLNVGFDNCKAKFGAPPCHLANATFIDGIFAGKTIQEVIDIADQVIGQCSNTYSPSQVNDALTQVNENYDNGTTDKGYFNCPSPCKRGVN
jgi:hypothetical protein